MMSLWARMMARKSTLFLPLTSLTMGLLVSMESSISRALRRMVASSAPKRSKWETIHRLTSMQNWKKCRHHFIILVLWVSSIHLVHAQTKPHPFCNRFRRASTSKASSSPRIYEIQNSSPIAISRAAVNVHVRPSRTFLMEGAHE